MRSSPSFSTDLAQQTGKFKMQMETNSHQANFQFYHNKHPYPPPLALDGEEVIPTTITISQVVPTSTSIQASPQSQAMLSQETNVSKQIIITKLIKLIYPLMKYLINKYYILD